MSTARAAVFIAPRQPMELREYPLPDPGAEEALIRITQANVCGSDLHMWRGDLAYLGQLPPLILGHEMTGRIAQLGAARRRDALGAPLAEGDRVVFTYFVPCGHCRPCLRGQVHACLAALASAVRRAHRVAAALRAGVVWVNSYGNLPYTVPFGGYKRSGIGREAGREALREYTQLKNVYVDLS